MIFDLEAELNKLNALMESEPFDVFKINVLFEEKQRLDEKLDSLYSLWVEENK